MVLQAEFADELSTNFEVDTATTTRDALKTLLQAKEIPSISGYSLYAIFKDKEILFGENEKVLDVVSAVEVLAGSQVPPEDPKRKPTAKEFQGLPFLLLTPLFFSSFPDHFFLPFLTIFSHTHRGRIPAPCRFHATRD